MAPESLGIRCSGRPVSVSGCVETLPWCRCRAKVYYSAFLCRLRLFVIQLLLRYL
ncbi:hypothetical protein PORCRE_1861 [Porphyromonas crevioricanis JCM 15906]|uniref:Uncharacterized protein n=1 Tax=Porphyromonas crevioricanis JCM 15906 TaxID=1305617 RepID=T1DU02_9PORP|nr:hypothetical protein PORCRE_1861 [Porphyromonas crevioricanis JCM 15906]GAD08019.1 hypothetical protein PORCAN_1649 [Porphyromonas crevioricanis JCM 13913]